MPELNSNPPSIEMNILELASGTVLSGKVPSTYIVRELRPVTTKRCT